MNRQLASYWVYGRVNRLTERLPSAARRSFTLARIAGRWVIRPAYRGPVDIFLRPWSGCVRRRHGLSLPGTGREASEGHYTQLIGTAAGWYHDHADGGDGGVRMFRFLASVCCWTAKARLYNGDSVLKREGTCSGAIGLIVEFGHSYRPVALRIPGTLS